MVHNGNIHIENGSYFGQLDLSAQLRVHYFIRILFNKNQRIISLILM